MKTFTIHTNDEYLETEFNIIARKQYNEYIDFDFSRLEKKLNVYQQETDESRDSREQAEKELKKIFATANQIYSKKLEKYNDNAPYFLHVFLKDKVEEFQTKYDSAKFDFDTAESDYLNEEDSEKTSHQPEIKEYYARTLQEHHHKLLDAQRDIDYYKRLYASFNSFAYMQGILPEQKNKDGGEYTLPVKTTHEHVVKHILKSIRKYSECPDFVAKEDPAIHLQKALDFSNIAVRYNLSNEQLKEILEDVQFVSSALQSSNSKYLLAASITSAYALKGQESILEKAQKLKGLIFPKQKVK